MKKVTIAAFIIGSFILYSFIYHANSVALVPNSTTNSGSSSGPASTSVVPTTPGATGTTGSTNVPGALYKDGPYTGIAADAQWGLIQVKAIIKNGKITDVQFLQYPNERNRSVEINSYADPQLTSEAIQAQSANVDIVSGATDSSDAFIQSLSDALSQAKA
jgi:uncharacterized protein with FMN-binding domain